MPEHLHIDMCLLYIIVNITLITARENNIYVIGCIIYTCYFMMRRRTLEIIRLRTIVVEDILDDDQWEYYLMSSMLTVF